MNVTREEGGPQPFTHLGVPNADHYRALLRTFARAKERFTVHLRPEDIAAELRIDADEQLTQALDQLVVWEPARGRRHQPRHLRRGLSP